MKRKQSAVVVAAIVQLTVIAGASAEIPTAKEYTNSIGIKLVRIEAGEFTMGCLNPTPFAKLKSHFESGHYEYLPDGDWDEHPVHKVTITQAFYMSETEVTLEQFRKFRADFQGLQEYEPCISNVSWEQAKAFCEWLSETEGKPYRLPTEAEWEYACRAATQTLFWSGDEPPNGGSANPWGLKNMHTPPAEWCLDWHGMYPDTDQVDPVGPANGRTKVIRGGGLDQVNELYYRRSANRAGFVPDFPHSQTKESTGLKVLGKLPVGFRIVLGNVPQTKPVPVARPFVQQCVNQDTRYATQTPDPDTPYFRKRALHPVPPENIPVANRRRAVLLAGLHPALLDHQHSPAMEVCSNGDVIAVYYTSDHQNEAAPEVALAISRLRFGTEQWGMPDILIDLLDTNDHAPLLWNDNGTLWLFWGGGGLGHPFKWCISEDNGATFGKINFPAITRDSRRGDAQPVNSVFRDADGAIYFACDAGNTMLWASSNNGKTWFDAGGRTGARHTTFALLADGAVLGMGGKSGAVDGSNPKSLSHDKGKTWQITGSGFPFLSSNQRPSLIRLASGRLLYATDFQNKWANQNQVPPERRGSWLAVSEDQGNTWKTKPLPGAQPHEQAHVARKAGGAATIGYSVLRQGPNGLIHLITSVNHPDLHFAFNEAWLLPANDQSRQLPQEPPATTITRIEEYEQEYSKAVIKAHCRGGVADNGRFLLDGTQRWFYDDGMRQWEVTYDKGRKVGTETCWARDGRKQWSWNHKKNAISIWTHFWPNGTKKSKSIWQNFKCQGPALRWKRNGRLADNIVFKQGMPFHSPPLWEATGVEYPK